MKALACDCGHTIRGKDENDVIKKGAEHAKKVHPNVKVTKDMEDQMRAHIRDE